MKAKKCLAALLAAIMTVMILPADTASADAVTVTAEKLNVRAKPDADGNSIGVVREGEELSFISEIGSWIQVKFDGQVGYVMEDYVRLDSEEVREDVKENTVSWQGKGVTTERVNIRALPMTGASIVKVAAKKAAVTITGVCGEWYQVKYSGKTGYLMGDYLTLSSDDEQIQATVKPEATKAPEQSGSGYGDGVPGVVTYRVNMRADASTDSNVLRVLDEGDPISIIGESGKWYWIIADGKEGYIVKTCAQIAGDGEIPKPTATVKPTATPRPTAAPEEEDGEILYAHAKVGTADERLNMRKSPSTSAKILMVLAKGQKVSVTGETGSWYKISLNGTEGYVTRSYLSVSEQSEATPAPTVKPTEQPEETKKPETYDEAKTGRTTARLNMRKSADTGASIVAVLPEGAKVTLLGESGSFYQVQYGNKSGYAAKAYVKIVDPEESAPEEDEKEETGSETIYSEAKTGKTTARVNMRREPEGSVLHVLSADTKVTMLGEKDSWYKVKYGSSTGYISKSYIREYDEDEEENVTESKGTTAYITGASVNMRKGPGTGYGVIRVLKVGTQIEYYSLKDGWYQIKAGSDTGYVSSKYVTTKKPEEDSSSSGSSGSVILSDWFKGEIQSAFGRGETVKITDVKTGLSFKATRTGGYYHADAQPTTSDDTEIMFRVYDNKWKWDRRAIWVTVDGKTYAASMNGMPHGETDSIKGNNFDGCFCIHFLNSKTHEGNRVDSGHQACVQAAYQAGK